MAKKKSAKPAEAKKPYTTSQYEKLGRALESVFASNYMSRSKLYWISFSRGLFTGLGVVLGGTLVVALLIWILSLFSEIPLLGEFAEKIQNTIEN